MNNPHHKYEDASNSWSEIDWSKVPDAPTYSTNVEISPTKLQRLYRAYDKYDYAMALVPRCHRLGYGGTHHLPCLCGDECRLVQLHLKWKEGPR